MSLWDKITNEIVNPNSDLRSKIPKDIAKAASDFTGSFVNKKLPPSAKAWLNKYSNDVITKVTIRRAPVHKNISKFLDLASGGRFEAGKKEMGYDDLFHLTLVIEHENTHTGKITESQLEKLERVTFTDKITEYPNTERIVVDIPKGQRIGGVTLRWMDKMGDDFYLYDAFANNCQTFIGGFLKATDALNAAGAKAFIYQNAKQLLEKLPGYLGDLAKSITNLGAIVNQLMQGGNMRGGAALRRAANGEWELVNAAGAVVGRFNNEAEARIQLAALAQQEAARAGSPLRVRRERVAPGRPAQVRRRRARVPGRAARRIVLDGDSDATESGNSADELDDIDLIIRNRKRRDDDDMEQPPPAAKRVRGGIRPPICRVGSKVSFAKLLDYVQPEHKIYVEPFFGSGAFYWHKQPVQTEIVNDLDKDTIKILKLIKTVSRDIKDYPNIDTVAKAQALFNKETGNSPEEEYIRNYIRTCGGFHSSPLKPGQKIFYTGNVGKSGKEKFNAMSRVKNIAEYKDRMKNTKISSSDYAAVIKDWDTKQTFFFMDPPYEKSTKSFGYAEHESFDFERFAKVVKGIKGKFIVTINDSPRIRDLFKGYNIYEVIVKGVGKTTKHESIGTKNREEILIANYDFPKDWKQHLGSARLMTGGSIFSDVYDSARSYVVDKAQKVADFARDATNPNKVANEIMNQVKNKDSLTRKHLLPLAQDIAVAAQPFIDVSYPGAGTAIKNVAVGINCANKIAAAAGYGRGKRKGAAKGDFEKVVAAHPGSNITQNPVFKYDNLTDTGLWANNPLNKAAKLAQFNNPKTIQGTKDTIRLHILSKHPHLPEQSINNIIEAELVDIKNLIETGGIVAAGGLKWASRVEFLDRLIQREVNKVLGKGMPVWRRRFT